MCKKVIQSNVGDCMYTLSMTSGRRTVGSRVLNSVLTPLVYSQDWRHCLSIGPGSGSRPKGINHGCHASRSYLGINNLRPFRIVLNYETFRQLRLLARCLLIYVPDFVYSVCIITERTITEHQGRMKQSQQIRVTQDDYPPSEFPSPHRSPTQVVDQGMLGTD